MGIIKAINLTVEQMHKPYGIDVNTPLFGWGFSNSIERGQKQTAYRIHVSTQESLLNSQHADMWDSGKIDTDQHQFIKYEGLPLLPEKSYVWTVCIWDVNGEESEWSERSTWTMGLMDQVWKADWIGLTPSIQNDWKQHSCEEPMPLFRHEFNISRSPVRVLAHVCGLGQYEFLLNGVKVGDAVLEPGWTDYDQSCLYHSYDVTSYMNDGQNAAGIMLGCGFYHVNGQTKRYVKYEGSYDLPKCIVQLTIEYSNGESESIGTGSDWEIDRSPIVFSSIYGGEDYDGRLYQTGWDKVGFIDSGNNWRSAPLVSAPKGTLCSRMIPRNKVQETIVAIKKKVNHRDIELYDLEKNISGWPRIRLKGKKGSSVTLVTGELIKDDSNIDQSMIGEPVSFTYTLRGENEMEEWAPKFMYHGFRYVQVRFTYQEERPELLSVQGEMIYPDVDEVGDFTCSNSEWKAIHDIINRSIKSNMKSIFTDCPHREKLGWIEQLHLMAPSVFYNYNVAPLYEKIFMDMEEAQEENGFVPNIAPEYVEFEGGFRDSPEWGSSFIMAPWYHYHWYGNDTAIKKHYTQMIRYVEYLVSSSTDGIVNHGLGDWGDLGEVPNDNQGFAVHTPIAVTATAMLFDISRIVAEIAQLLGHGDDVKRFKRVALETKNAFNQAFFNENHSFYATNSQTANSTALALDLVKEQDKDKVLSNLVTGLIENDYAITCGEVGHRYLLLALAKYDRSDIVEKMLQQSKEPYYQFLVSHGATSLTEFWDGPLTGHSHNHIMMGHIEEWFYSQLSGIQIDYTGKKIYPLSISPFIAEHVDWVKTRHKLASGLLGSSVEKERG
ncbi:family 78 glycoside hydrolase catalytic domain [Alkalicoccobacillus plakortidis]|uniref:alpha-L-rhamnosidase n=1 Tax=Alkalicoccobacillus plakortidis TaxID=444060 RepID=A0ABT0XH19_9BACI|nr:family 78 glycoside hydrolase catalytic domain [Alkalicoccobacillus plakortidis]MCM2674502.1 family 78 glycoside hydrolase catalytic domain [Alkalicoccobacillus plakortidis]